MKIKPQARSKDFPDFLNSIIEFLVIKEAKGWNGEDLNEEQLNVLTLISDVYLKRDKSKYKQIQKPSEIVAWFLSWIQAVFSKTKLSWECCNKKFLSLGEQDAVQIKEITNEKNFTQLLK